MPSDNSESVGTPRRTVLRKGAIGGSVGLLGFSSVSRTGAQDGPTVITEPTTIEEPGEYVLGNDLTVEGGDGLRVESFEEITLDGNGYRIEGNGSGTGLYIWAGGDHTIRNITIQNFETGIGAYSGTDPMFSSVTVQYNTGDGIVEGYDGAVHCEDSTIRGNGGRGIITDDYSSATIQNCEIVENGSNPIWSGSSAIMHVEDCYIADNREPFYFTPMPDSKVEGTHVSGSDGAGIYITYGDLVYRDEPALITDCVVRDNADAGIYHDSSFLEVRGCTLTGNRAGYHADNSAYRDTILRHNDIEDNEEYGVLHGRDRDYNSSVDARCNWWGDESGPVHEDNPNENPQGDRVSDGVEFTPWSVERNEDGEAACEGGLDEDAPTRGGGFISRKSYRKVMSAGPYADIDCWDGTFYVTDPSDVEADGQGGPGEFSLPTPYCDAGEEKRLSGRVIRAEPEAVPVRLPTWGGDRGDCESLLFVDAERLLPTDVEYRIVPNEGPTLAYKGVETNGFAGTIDTLVWVSFKRATLEDGADEAVADE